MRLFQAIHVLLKKTSVGKCFKKREEKKYIYNHLRRTSSSVFQEKNDLDSCSDYRGRMGLRHIDGLSNICRLVIGSASC